MSARTSEQLRGVWIRLNLLPPCSHYENQQILHSTWQREKCIRKTVKEDDEDDNEYFCWPDICRWSSISSSTSILLRDNTLISQITTPSKPELPVKYTGQTLKDTLWLKIASKFIGQSHQRGWWGWCPNCRLRKVYYAGITWTERDKHLEQEIMSWFKAIELESYDSKVQSNIKTIQCIC